MKKRNLWAALLALALAMSLTVPAAAATRSEITVADAQEGEEYRLYKLFDAEQSDDESSITYTIAKDSPWKAVLGAYTYDQDGDGTKEQIFTWQDIVGRSDRQTVAYPAGFTDGGDLAQYLADYLKGQTIGADQTVTAQKQSDGSVEAKFKGLGLGYYFVTTTTGSLCSIDTNNSKVEIRDKNDYPSVGKTVDKETATIGETLTYTLKVKIPATADQEIRVIDVMEAGLTLIKEPDGKPGEYEVAVSGQTITITFLADYVKSLTQDTEVELIYTAYINTENGEIYREVNENTVHLEYSKLITPEITTQVKTFYASFIKLDGKTRAPLEGVTFRLEDAGGQPIQVVAVADGVYRVADEDEKGTASEATTLATASDGTLKIEGLGNGTYQLAELSTHPGYNLLPEPCRFVINGDNDAYTEKSDTVQDHNVILNNTGAELPSTGGMGTTVFYSLGALLVSAAGACLITKKRLGGRQP